LLDYDNVANEQRKVIYSQRDELLSADDISETVEQIRIDVVDELVDGYMPPQSLEEQWDIEGLESALSSEFGMALPVGGWLSDDDDIDAEAVKERITRELLADYERKTEILGQDRSVFEKQMFLQILDRLWKEHLAMMDYLRQSIHLRAYAQKKPIQEYKKESFELFEQLLGNIKNEVVRFFSRVQFSVEDSVESLEQQREEQRALQARAQARHEEAETLTGGSGAPEQAPQPPKPETFKRQGRKVGRNEPCPCGSGKKYKHCCGKVMA